MGFVGTITWKLEKVGEARLFECEEKLKPSKMIICLINHPDIISSINAFVLIKQLWFMADDRMNCACLRLLGHEHDCLVASYSQIFAQASFK